MARFVSLLAALIFFAAGAAGAQDLVSRYVAGDHYKVIDKPVAQPHDGKVHVAEFFLYSCPHCYRLEPKLNAWRAQLGDDVVFTRVPVLFGAAGHAYARLFYAEKALGVVAKLHDAIFDAIHQQGRRLTTQKAMRAFMVAHGIDGERFDQVFTSDRVSGDVRAAGKLMRRFHVLATPSMSVAGRYWISGRTAGSNEAMFDVADYLIGKARADEETAPQ